MIGRLRKRFIRIAVLSVALVMLALSLIVNAANYISVNSDIDSLLNMLSSGRTGEGQLQHGGPGKDGTAPGRGEGMPAGEPDWFDERGGGRRFGEETQFSTRYFVLYFDTGGELSDCDLQHIASVTEEDIDDFLSAALRRGAGRGYYGSYKYLVRENSDGSGSAVFIECYSQLRSIRNVALMTLAADVLCLMLVYLLVVIFSKKAIDPVVRSAQQQKQFITDASHELKTPLTVMKTCMTVLEMEVGKQKWIDKANAQTDKMTELVNSLVTLSRMDEEEPPITLADFDVGAAVEETVQSFADSALAEGHGIKTDIEQNVVYHGDETAIRQLVSILMDNAIKYASDGGDISISLKKEHRGVVIRQSNPCAPIEQAELDRLFDRFYRADKSRSSEKKGFGVGLSIARGIAEAHKGGVSASCTEDGVIEFTAILK